MGGMAGDWNLIDHRIQFLGNGVIAIKILAGCVVSRLADTEGMY